jgi:hypothetical protein
VLIIDECDKASNNHLFLQLIGKLRDKYLLAQRQADFTFQSVILAGVYSLNQDFQDSRINRIKEKEVQSVVQSFNPVNPDLNLPWNIAAHFEVDMSLSIDEIASMLQDYENDHHTGMDIQTIANELRSYTNGYPFLVSQLCKTIDEKLKRNWSKEGLQKSVKELLYSDNTLFDDIGKNLANYPEVSELMFRLVVLGEEVTYDTTDLAQKLCLTFGLVRNDGEKIAVDNQIFETLLANHFANKLRSSKTIDVASALPDTADKIRGDGKFNMPLCIRKFAEHYYELFNGKSAKYLERECRILFITYLKPLLNGKGFYHIETQTRNETRMDIVVDYGPEQHIVELKLWYGEIAHEKALDQLWGYLDGKGANTGYLLTFDFRRGHPSKRGEKVSGKPTSKWVEYKGKKIFDCMVGR